MTGIHMKHGHLMMTSKYYCIFTVDSQLLYFGYEKNEHYKIIQGSATVFTE